MSLRVQAAEDFKHIINDDAGLGLSVTLTDPTGSVITINSLNNDIYQFIDTDTDLPVSGRYATVVFSTLDLAEKQVCIPIGILSELKNPWTVCYTDINGDKHSWMVQSTEPDRSIGGIVCKLRVYKQ